MTPTFFTADTHFGHAGIVDMFGRPKTVCLQIIPAWSFFSVHADVRFLES